MTITDRRLVHAAPNVVAALAGGNITTTGQTSISVATGYGAFFANTPLVAQIIDTADRLTATKHEDVLVTDQSGDTLTIQRDLYGAGAQTFPTGGTIWLLAAAETINRLVTAVQAAAGTIAVEQLATGGSGTLADPWTGWSAALASNYPPVFAEANAGAGHKFKFGRGYFLQDTMIDMGIGWVLEGMGPLATRITSNQTGSFIQVRCLNPYGLPGERVLLNQRGGIRGIRFDNTTATTGTNVDLTNIAYMHIENVSVAGGLHGFVLDGTEHCSVTAFDTGVHTGKAFWLLGGSEHEATYPGGQFTNANVISQGNINGAACGLAMDGGQVNTVVGVGFSACTTPIHAAATESFTLQGCYIEGGGTSRIILSDTSYDGVTKSRNFAFTVKDNWITASTATKSCIEGVGTPGTLISEGNSFAATTAAAIKGCALFTNMSSKGDVLAGTTVTLLDANPATGLLLGDPDGAGTHWGVGVSTADFGGGKGVIAFAPAATVPTTNGIALGGILYVEAGSLKFRTSAGNVRVVAAV